MKVYLAIGGFAIWTCAVAYYANQHGYGRAEQVCQEERDRAVAEKERLEGEHAESGKKYEEDRKHDQDQIDSLEQRLSRLSRDKPSACSLGTDRRLLWNEANAGTGTPVSGEPAGDVRDPVPDH